MEIVDAVYRLTAKFPSFEKFGLCSQMQRASISIPSNIAEGFARQYTKEYKQMLFIALGSCAELETQTIIATRRRYIDKQVSESLIDNLNHEARMLMGLIKSLRF